jgi:hypothetical protein
MGDRFEGGEGSLWNGEREDLKYELERSAELRKVIWGRNLEPSGRRKVNKIEFFPWLASGNWQFGDMGHFLRKRERPSTKKLMNGDLGLMGHISPSLTWKIKDGWRDFEREEVAIALRDMGGTKLWDQMALLWLCSNTVGVW